MRGGEAFDLLQALNTGHLESDDDHANLPNKRHAAGALCPDRECLALHHSIREAIAPAINVVVSHAPRPAVELPRWRVVKYDTSSDRFRLDVATSRRRHRRIAAGDMGGMGKRRRTVLRRPETARLSARQPTENA